MKCLLFLPLGPNSASLIVGAAIGSGCFILAIISITPTLILCISRSKYYTYMYVVLKLYKLVNKHMHLQSKCK